MFLPKSYTQISHIFSTHALNKFLSPKHRIHPGYLCLKIHTQTHNFSQVQIETTSFRVVVPMRITRFRLRTQQCGRTQKWSGSIMGKLTSAQKIWPSTLLHLDTTSKSEVITDLVVKGPKVKFAVFKIAFWGSSFTHIGKAFLVKLFCSTDPERRSWIK